MNKMSSKKSSNKPSTAVWSDGTDKVTCLAIGDPHFQVNNVIDAEDLIKKVNKLVIQLQPTFVVILGDLLHTHEKIHITPFNLATKLITSLARKVQVFLIIGNHDYCFGKDTEILLWDGSVKMSQDIQIGDKLIGDDGEPRTVAKLLTGKAVMYTISQQKGMTYSVTGNHTLSLKCGLHKSKFWNNTKSRWTVKWLSSDYHLKSKFFRTEEDANEYLNQIDDIDTIDITVKEYLDIPKNVRDRLYGYRAPFVNWPSRNVQLDPYILGAWLGDGCKAGGAFASADAEIIYSWIEWGLKNGAEIVHTGQYNYIVKNYNYTRPETNRHPLNSSTSSCYTCPACISHREKYKRAPSIACANSKELALLIDGDENLYNYLSEGASVEQLEILHDPQMLNDLYNRRVAIENVQHLEIQYTRSNSNPLREQIKYYNLYHNKHIPMDYILNDKKTRLELLAGFIDTDGTVHPDKRTITIIQGGKNQHMCKSLLYLCRSLGFAAHMTFRDNSTTITVSGDVDQIPIRITRKKCSPIMNNGIDSRGRKCADKLRTNITVTEQGINNFYGWELAEDPRFLLGDFTVTHNCNNQQYLTSNHAFNSFKKIPNVTVCDRVIMRTINNMKFIFCPYVPPERFEEALCTLEDKGRRWDDAECIFAHQEFYGCRFNPVMTSTEGDIWPENYPLVVSGHIHNEQRLQSNIYYTGSSMQHAFGETANKTIAFLTFKENEKFTLKKIDLEMRKKKIVYMDVDKADLYKQQPNTLVKLVLKGRPEEFKVFRRGQAYKELQKQGIAVSFSPQNVTVQATRETQKRNVLDILEELIKDENKYVHEAFDELRN